MFPFCSLHGRLGGINDEEKSATWNVTMSPCYLWCDWFLRSPPLPVILVWMTSEKKIREKGWQKENREWMRGWHEWEAGSTEKREEGIERWGIRLWHQRFRRHSSLFSFIHTLLVTSMFSLLFSDGIGCSLVFPSPRVANKLQISFSWQVDMQYPSSFQFTLSLWLFIKVKQRDIHPPSACVWTFPVSERNENSSWRLCRPSFTFSNTSHSLLLPNLFSSMTSRTLTLFQNKEISARSPISQCKFASFPAFPDRLVGLVQERHTSRSKWALIRGRTSWCYGSLFH
jgi:hypothetical protein